MDTSLNKSEGVTVKATPEVASGDVMKISLSVPEEKSNTSVTVSAVIKTAGTVKNVVYKKDGSINPAKLLADTDAEEATADENNNTKWTFTIAAKDETANGTYTVAAIDSDGREEIDQITIDKFDFTAPLKPTDVTGTYSESDSKITLSWTNPTDDDFERVEIYYTTNDGSSESVASETLSVTAGETTYSDIDASKAYYTFYFASVDKLENKSKEVKYNVGVSSFVSNVPEGFVEIPAASITGTETWEPYSNIFVSNRALEIAAFYMSDHEVTQDEFEAVMGTNPSKTDTTGEAGNNPVNYVNWYQAIAYCNKLSVKEELTPCYTVEGITDWENFSYSDIPTSDNSTWNAATCDFTADGYRLPTEAEWEWAARGGENYTYAGSNTIDDVAWYSVNSTSATHEVKTKAKNGYGLYDMSGNVWEWCWDWYGEITSSTASTGAYGSYRCLRGGSWLSVAGDGCEVFNRHKNSPSSRNYTYGFRLVRTAQ